jgi:hypothetical protein
MSIIKLLTAGAFALASLSLAASVHAEVKHPAKAKTSKSAKQAAPKEPDEEADEPAVTGSAVTEFDCELGNKITIYRNEGDLAHIALRWKKRLHRLTQVGTTTGAQRFENKFYGLVWIGIPAKGMLLDSKGGHQLANECRNAEQAKSMSMTPVSEGKM